MISVRSTALRFSTVILLMAAFAIAYAQDPPGRVRVLAGKPADVDPDVVYDQFVNTTTGSLKLSINLNVDSQWSDLLEIPMTYNSDNPSAGFDLLGDGWVLGYSDRIDELAGGTLELHDDKGRTVEFQSVGPGVYVPVAPATSWPHLQLDVTNDTTLTETYGGGVQKTFVRPNATATQWHLTSVSLADGTVLTVTRAGDEVRKVFSSSGGGAILSYTNGRVSSVQAPGSPAATLGYVGGRLDSVNLSSGLAYEFSYSQSSNHGWLLGGLVVDGEPFATYEYYDPAGGPLRIRSVERFVGSTTFIYEDGWNETIATDDYTGFVSYGYDASGRTVSITTPSQKVDRTFNNSGQVDQLIKNGETVQYTYQGSKLTQIVDPDGLSALVNYDTAGKVVSLQTRSGALEPISLDSGDSAAGEDLALLIGELIGAPANPAGDSGATHKEFALFDTRVLMGAPSIYEYHSTDSPDWLSSPGHITMMRPDPASAMRSHTVDPAVGSQAISELEQLDPGTGEAGLHAGMTCYQVIEIQQVADPWGPACICDDEPNCLMPPTDPECQDVIFEVCFSTGGGGCCGEIDPICTFTLNGPDERLLNEQAIYTIFGGANCSGQASYTSSTGEAPQASSNQAATFVFTTPGTRTITASWGNQTRSVTTTVLPASLPCSFNTTVLPPIGNVGDTFTATTTGTCQSYSYSATGGGGCPTNGSGTTFQTRFASAGAKQINVSGTSGGPDETVSVRSVNVGCTDITGDTAIDSGQQACFSAGANAQYGTVNWIAPGGVPSSGSGSSFCTTFAIAGTYNVTASLNVTLDECGASGSCSESISVDVAPSCSAAQILMAPQDGAGFVGSSVDFSVSAAGESLQYQWLLGGNPVGTNSPNLTLSSVQAVDNGKPVTVQISNFCSSVTSSPAVLSVYTVDFVSPSASATQLFGEEIRWEAQVDGPSALAGATWSFEYEAGSGTPASGPGAASGANQLFDSTPSNEGASTIKVTVTAPGVSGQGTATRSIDLVKPEVTELSFLNDIELRHWETNDTGADIDDPVWIKPLGQTTTDKDYPAAYRRSRPNDSRFATVSPKIEASSALTSEALIRVRGMGIETFGFDEVFVQNWTFMPGELELVSSPLFGGNNTYDPMAINWEYIVRKQDGSWPDWADAVAINTTEHKVYTLYALPKPEAMVNGRVFDEALERACNEYAKGRRQAAVISQQINTGIGALEYDPAAAVVQGVPLNAYSAPACLCWNWARLMTLLAQSVGIDAETRMFWGGESDEALEYMYLAGNVGGQNLYGKASFQSTFCGHDQAGDNAHFTYHAQSKIGSVYYDPSFNRVDKATSHYECEALDGRVTDLFDAAESVGIPIILATTPGQCATNEFTGPQQCQ